MQKKTAISEIVELFDDCVPADHSLGAQKIDIIKNTAKKIANDKGWFDYFDFHNHKTPHEQIELEVFLMNYVLSKKLVWFVYFTYHFTVEEIEKYSMQDADSMSFALVKIDDSSGEVLSADPIRSQPIKKDVPR